MSQKEIEEENDRNWKTWREEPLEYFVIGLMGECGELANLVKKYLRWKLGWSGNCVDEKEFKKQLKGELADIEIYQSLIAGKFNLNIEELVREKQIINRKRFGWK
jgi:NTP pyrophosphatase (non-canonical NTP hydrolase)